jgi:hypothetical protein
VIFSAADLKTYMAITGTQYDLILQTIADGVNGATKKYLGR